MAAWLERQTCNLDSSPALITVAPSSTPRPPSGDS